MDNRDESNGRDTACDQSLPKRSNLTGQVMRYVVCLVGARRVRMNNGKRRDKGSLLKHCDFLLVALPMSRFSTQGFDAHAQAASVLGVSWRTWPPPELLEVPEAYIVDKLRASAPAYWDSKESTNCTLCTYAIEHVRPISDQLQSFLDIVPKGSALEPLVLAHSTTKTQRFSLVHLKVPPPKVYFRADGVPRRMSLKGAC